MRITILKYILIVAICRNSVAFLSNQIFKAIAPTIHFKAKTFRRISYSNESALTLRKQ